MSRKIRLFFLRAVVVAVVLFTTRCIYIYIHIHIGGNRGRLTPQDFLLLNVTTSDSPLRLTMGMDSEGRPKGIHYNKGTFALPCVTREPGCVNRQFDADRAGGWISTKMKTDVV